jgi:Zn-dependent peptidase ImmA (M78 family)/transcriptional regulator with XRE-family HTH domain
MIKQHVLDTACHEYISKSSEETLYHISEIMLERSVFARFSCNNLQIFYNYAIKHGIYFMEEKIGKKIRAERERKKISQERLAQALGWSHHQIVSEIEQGNREIKAWELYEIAKFLNVNIDVLLGSKEQTHRHILWRQKPTEHQELIKAESIFNTECDNYNFIEEVVRGHAQFIHKQLPQITIDVKKYTLSEAYQLAESIRDNIPLGDFPASQLIRVLEEYGVKFIVLQDEISSPAACCRSDKGNFIFLNGRDVESRQLFSIAHELFHLITWDNEMLQLLEKNKQLHEKNEQLANAFAAGLLIPSEKLQIEVRKINPQCHISGPDVIALSELFQVSKDAMLYRMLNTRLISKKHHEELQKLLQHIPSSKHAGQTNTKILKSKLVRQVYLAYEHVKISRAKAAKLLHIDLCDVSDFFSEYGFVEFNAV